MLLELTFTQKSLAKITIHGYLNLCPSFLCEGMNQKHIYFAK